MSISFWRYTQKTYVRIIDVGSAMGGGGGRPCGGFVGVGTVARKGDREREGKGGGGGGETGEKLNLLSWTT